jgi:hypothetical protein
MRLIWASKPIERFVFSFLFFHTQACIEKQEKKRRPKQNSPAPRQQQKNAAQGSILQPHVYACSRARLVVLVCCVLDVQSQSLNSTFWPDQWYGTWRFYNSSNSGSVLEYGWWFYDYPNQFLRMDNNLGFCPDPSNPTQFIFCEGVFNLDTFFLYAPTLDVCCLCMPGIGMSAPDWIYNFASSASINEDVLYDQLDILSTQVTFTDFDGETHYYYQSSLSMLPVALADMNTTQDPTQNQWLDLTVGQLPSGANNLPQNCDGTCPEAFGCGSSETLFQKNKYLSLFLKNLKK